MRVIVKIDSQAQRGYLFHLDRDLLAKEVKRFIASELHDHAIVSILLKGRFEREVFGKEISDIEADLILTRLAARWDLGR